MGRRPDPPGVQAAKGNPGRRKSKAQKQAEQREVAAAALAAVPVTPAHGTRLEPPAQLIALGELGDGGRDLAHRALGVWAELGPELENTNRLQPHHRLAFAMFCIYLAEWWAACEDLAKNGRSQTVPTVSGGVMERDRPAVRWRAEAFANAQEAAKQFGLTPREEYALFKDQQMVVRENPGFFSRGGAAPEAANDQKPAPAPTTSIGAMGRLKSAPPATSLN